MPIVNIDKANADTLIQMPGYFASAAIEFLMKHNDSKALDQMAEISKCGAYLWLNILWKRISGGYRNN